MEKLITENYVLSDTIYEKHEHRNVCSDYIYIQFSSVQLLSRVQLFAILWISAHQASLSITNSQSSLKLT